MKTVSFHSNYSPTITEYSTLYTILYKVLSTLQKSVEYVFKNM